MSLVCHCFCRLGFWVGGFSTGSTVPRRTPTLPSLPTDKMLSRGQETLTTQVEYISGSEARDSPTVPSWSQASLVHRNGRTNSEQYQRTRATDNKGAFKERQARLVSWADAPSVLQFNKYIRSGYRANYTYAECAASVLSIHNETGNIWTHLVPMMLLLLLVFGGLERPWEHAPVAYYANTLSILGCFLLSVCYHTFMGCHHHYHNWLTLDVCGVYMALLGSEWVVVDWGFPCHPTIRLSATVVYYAIGLTGLLFSCCASSAMLRGVPMLALTVTRLGLLVLRGVLSGGSTEAVGYYWAMEAIALFGGVVNVARWPEKWVQPKGKRQAGLLDYWGNSHQIMHISVAVGLLLVHWAMAIDLRESSKPGAMCPVT